MPTPSETLQQAMALHRNGRLAEAEQAYHNVPESAPEAVDAIHLLGVIALQRGNPQGAVALIQRAIGIRGNVPAMHSNLGESLRTMGRNAEALAAFEKALQLDPKYHACRGNMALALSALGRHTEAEDALRQVLEAEPRNALAWNNLANVLRSAGKADDALAAAHRAVQLEPANPEFLSNLGQLLLEDGDFDDALVRLQNAVKLAPALAAARNNLGNVLRELGRLDEADQQYQEALRLRPELAITHNNMGQLCQQRQQYDAAIEWYQKSLQLDPRASRTLCNFASALAEVDRQGDAAQCYRTALAIDPKSAEAHAGLASILKQRGDNAGVRELLEKSIALGPKLSAPRLVLAGLMGEEGRFEEAEKLARRAIELDPFAAGAYEVLANHRRKSITDADLKHMHELLNAGPRLREGARLSLCYALGMVNDGNKNFAEAAKYLDAANELQAKQQAARKRDYSPDEHTQWASDLMAAFSPQHFERVKDWGHPSKTPVFVLGLPRSGTTLAEQILASHSKVFGADELRFARESYEALPEAIGQQCTPAQAVPQLNATALLKVAQTHLEKLQAKAPGSDYIIDKMPENYAHIGLILSMFPNARIIHMQRDLRDVATSCWNVHFAQIRWACRKEHIERHFENYLRLMRHWREVVPGRFFEIRYEDLVQDLEGGVKRLLDWVGLEFEPQCLEFWKTERNVRTASLAQVRQPLYSASAGRWKNYEAQWGDWYARLDKLQTQA